MVSYSVALEENFEETLLMLVARAQTTILTRDLRSWTVRILNHTAWANKNNLNYILINLWKNGTVLSKFSLRENSNKRANTNGEM